MNSVVIPNPKQAYTKLPGLHSATHIRPRATVGDSKIIL